ncbi:hypothetical protein BH23THE1_BH23THE1_04010 [soil metagenome]
MNRPIYYFGCQDFDTAIEKRICIVPLQKQDQQECSSRYELCY